MKPLYLMEKIDFDSFTSLIKSRGFFVNERIAWNNFHDQGWTFNYNYWTGATRQDFSTNGSIWCPSRIAVSSPWNLVGGSNKTIMGKSDCVALQISQNKTNYTTTYSGNLIYSNCSQRKMLSCRVIFVMLLSKAGLFLHTA
jgi:hypothetical protein